MEEKKYQLLDCTLRDGGYVNDWCFGKNNITAIFERLVSAGVDVIEVGFLDERRPFDPERTIMPDTKSVRKIFGSMNKGTAKTVAMIDYGTCSLEKLEPAPESWLDGIRVIFKKEKRVPAIAFCKKVKELGYQVYCQLVSITSYTDEELKEVTQLVNDCHPYAMSMVDTYGLCDARQLGHIVKTIDQYLDQDIVLGYHAHNNFQLAYSNSISVLNAGLKRSVLVDGTLYGMGKSAGNAPLELLAMYMNLNFGTQYRLGQIQEVISNCILDLYHNKPWGYTLFYYIAALNRCHPDYVSWLMSKQTLSVTQINQILSRLPEEEKLKKNIALLEQIYLEFQKKECDDAAALAELSSVLKGREVLMIGPGKQEELSKDKIQNYICEHHPVVIPINYFPAGIKEDYLFLTNARRHLQLAGDLAAHHADGTKIIASSNLTAPEDSFDYLVNFCSLIDETEEFPDNSMEMLVRLLEKLGVTKLTLAGFDGYNAQRVNYFDANMEYSFIRQKAEALNESGRRFFAARKGKMDIHFLTESRYENA